MFFFQAEDGIRDLVRSRGLGDVYKRQVVDLSQVTFITDTGVDALKTLASTAKSAGNPVAFVCSELIMRAELVLADLDLLAPVLQAPEQALALVGRAA